MCGGASALTILREIKYDPAIRSLTANPVEELAGLRTSSLANITTPLALGAGTTHEIPVGSNHTITMLLLIVLLSITHIMYTRAWMCRERETSMQPPLRTYF